MSTAFVFSLDTNHLQAEACLLAASLRKWLGSGPELIGTLPEGTEAEALEPETRRLLKALRVRIDAVRNPIGGNYKIGYKLLSLDVPTKAQRIVFLDSDMICLRRFDPDALFGEGFAAKPTDVVYRGASIRYWRGIYATCGMRLPQQRVRASVAGTLMPPYFNAGLVAVPANTGFGALWARMAKRLDRAFWVRNKRPWLDQLALPVAMRKSGLPWRVLTEAENHPTHLVSLPDALPAISHYHGPDVVGREPVLAAQAGGLVADWPDLEALLRRFNAWRALLDAPEALLVDPGAGRTLVVGGVPDHTGQGARILAGDDACVLHDPPGWWRAVERSVPQDASGAWIAAIRQFLQVRDHGSLDVRRPIVVAPQDIADDRLEGSAGPLLVIAGGARTVRELNEIRAAQPAARVMVLVDAPAVAVAAWMRRPDAITEAVPATAGDLALRWAESTERALATEGVAVVPSEAWCRDPQAVLDRLWKDWDWGRPPRVDAPGTMEEAPILGGRDAAQVARITVESVRCLRERQGLSPSAAGSGPSRATPGAERR